MQRVLTFPLVHSSTLKHFKFSRQAIIEQKLFSNLVHSLSKVKKSNNVAKLAVKHAILTAVVSSDKSRSSCRQTTRLLNVHPWNVTKVVQC
jgi:hypothetical protein